MNPSTTDYSNRTVDLLLLQFIAHPTLAQKVTPDVTNIPRIVTGLEKLVQRYALLFLTKRGSVKNCEQEGTDIVHAVIAGKVYNDSILRTYANQANMWVTNLIKSEDSSIPDTPLDEQLKSTSVIETRLDKQQGKAFVSIKITSKANEEYIYVTPLAIGV